jgi:hypothetical protein
LILLDCFDEKQETICSLRGPLSKELYELQIVIDNFMSDTIVDNKGIIINQNSKLLLLSV